MKCYKKNYPRPQFVRDNWVDLSGEWGFRFDDENRGEIEKWYQTFDAQRKIQVPFTYETEKSGIGDESVHNYVWYRRTFEIDKKAMKNQRAILHFEGSDFTTKVWVNGECLGQHKGGYTRFSFDMTSVLADGENIVTVRVEDSLDPRQPRGKQRWLPKNFGCWYVQTTGIWKSVWMEMVPESRLEHVKMTPDLEKGTLEIECMLEGAKGRNLDVEAAAFFKDTLVARCRAMVDEDIVRMQLDLRGIHNADTEWGFYKWSPEEPNLYDIEFRVYEGTELLDEVGSYFGMREIRIDGPNILLNGEPLYQRLILDQGYWKESHLTPPDEEALVTDIKKVQNLGYNGIRKHQNTEDERFLYWCDVMGMLVWGEAPSNYTYTDDSVVLFMKEWSDIVRQNYNHPSIITWTPVNESWGVPSVETEPMQQHFTEMIYHLTKSLDKGRPVIVNDGWEHTVSDIITLHDYEEKGEDFLHRYLAHKDELMDTRIYHCNRKSAFANGYIYKGQPIIISEFGGIAFDNGEQGWGYGNKVNSKEEFIKRFDDITTAMKKLPYSCGYCYTQVTDIQQEINGLMDIERNYKIEPEIIREINLRKVDTVE